MSCPPTQLPDAAEGLEDTEFPLAYALASAGCLAIMALEKAAHLVAARRLRDEPDGLVDSRDADCALLCPRGVVGRQAGVRVDG